MVYFDKGLPEISSVHPDDIDSFLHYQKNLKMRKNNELSHILYRADCCNGQWKWVLRRDMIYSRNKDGSVKQVLGSITNITMPEKMENSIKSSEAS